MDVTRFPHEPLTDHPQFLWNEQEYVVRMLCQNALGAGMDEDASSVAVTTQAALSLNTVAHGPADFPQRVLREAFSTGATRWVYLAADGGRLYADTDRPEYSQYLHGWYHRTRGDRALVFIDPDQPPGHRAMAMDSFNSMYEYEQRIPDTGGELFWAITAPSEHQWSTSTLPAGNYRFELRGGNGGSGGGNQRGQPGGHGGQGQVIVWKLRILSATTLFGILGGNGANGGSGSRASGNWFLVGPPFVPPAAAFNARNWSITGGGGGSSGGDTRLRFGSRIVLDAIGGAGGGGAGGDMHRDVGHIFLSHFAPGAGGGAGFGGAGAGSNNEAPGGRQGTLDLGGLGGGGAGGENDIIDFGNFRGQSREGGLIRRNGGTSTELMTLGASPGWGGSSFSGTSGFFRCYRTRDDTR